MKEFISNHSGVILDFAVLIIGIIIGLIVHAVRVSYTLGHLSAEIMKKCEAEKIFPRREEVLIRERNGKNQYIRYSDMEDFIQKYCNIQQDKFENSLNMIQHRLDSIEGRLLVIEEHMISRG